MRHPAGDQRLRDAAKLLPRARRLETERRELTPPVPDPGNRSERRDSEGPAAGPVGRHERLEEVDLVLVPNPVRVDVLERIEKARRGELGDPDGVEDREIGGAAFGDRVRQYVMQLGQRDGDDVHLDAVRRRVADDLPPQALPRRRRAPRADPAVGASSVG